MIAVDTNLLVYAHRVDMPLHERALKVLEELVASVNSWAIPWPCVYEFISVVTNPRIFKTPSSLTIAFDVVRTWSQGGNLQFIGEGVDFVGVLEKIVLPTKLSGARIHDGRIAAICVYHGINELWSCDRDFSLFPKLRTKNPLV